MSSFKTVTTAAIPVFGKNEYFKALMAGKISSKNMVSVSVWVESPPVVTLRDGFDAYSFEFFRRVYHYLLEHHADDPPLVFAWAEGSPSYGRPGVEGISVYKGTEGASGVHRVFVAVDDDNFTLWHKVLLT